MITYEELQIKNPPGYFFRSMTNIMKLDTSLLGVNQIPFINDEAVIYEIEYFNDFDNETPLYFVFNNVDVDNVVVGNVDKYLFYRSNRKKQRNARKIERTLGCNWRRN